MQCTSCSAVVRPVVAVDIDGTLGEYHDHFTKFAEGYFGTHLPQGYDGSDEFSSWLGLSKEDYRQAKLAYRQGGLKRTMPMRFGAKRLIISLRRSGAEVWLCTTRPWMRLDNIDPDTREWLRRNGVGYDGLLYGEDKYARLLETVEARRVVGVYDDLLTMCQHAEDVGLDAIQASSPSNRAMRARYDHRLTTMEAEEALVHRINRWNQGATDGN